ncbi:uncharacterized protein LOC142228795 isoform X1 [Haematobia irritans]|uniref:uncharacterized protein LOC142228795 isoform X1 n=1 Tax=Haematobia irritans TaxID=7368 RepID=UPI003F5047F4
MTDAYRCQLCRSTCNDSLRLRDANGQPNQVYNMTIQFFDEKFLEIQRGATNLVSVLCMECWRHIANFNNFHRSILLLQENLNNQIENEDFMEEDDIKNVSHDIITTGKYELQDCTNSITTVNDNDKQEMLLETPTTQSEIPSSSVFGRGQLIITDHEIKFQTELVDEIQSKSSLEDAVLADDMPLDDLEFAYLNDHTNNTQMEIENESQLNADSSSQDSQSANETSLLKKLPKTRRSEQEMEETIAKWNSALECYVCQQTFETFALIRTHFTDEHQGTEFYILCCDRKFKYRSRLEEHAGYHMYPDAYQCTTCNKYFGSKWILLHHRLVKHGTPEGPIIRKSEENYKHVCDICDKRFRVPSDLREHNATHTGERSHPCPFCTKIFKFSTSLAYHFTSVHYEREVKRDSLGFMKCQACKERFKHIKKLLRHMQTMHPSKDVTTK